MYDQKDVHKSWIDYVADKIGHGAASFRVGFRKQSRGKGHDLLVDEAGNHINVTTASFQWAVQSDSISLEIAKNLWSMANDHWDDIARPDSTDYAIYSYGATGQQLGEPHGKNGRIEVQRGEDARPGMGGESLEAALRVIGIQGSMLERQAKGFNLLVDKVVDVATGIGTMTATFTTALQSMADSSLVHHDGRATIADAQARIAEAEASVGKTEAHMQGAAEAFGKLLEQPFTAKLIGGLVDRFSADKPAAAGPSSAVILTLSRAALESETLAAMVPSLRSWLAALEADDADAAAREIEQVRTEWADQRDISSVDPAVARALDSACKV
jgi:hypothetical protein